MIPGVPEMNIRYVPLILFSVFLSAGAQLMLKKGMSGVSFAGVQGGALVSAIFRVILDPWVFAGLSFYVLGILPWMYVLSKVEVSYAYPFVSIGYVVVVVGAYFFFREPISAMKMAGVLLICLGVLLVAKSS